MAGKHWTSGDERGNRKQKTGDRIQKGKKIDSESAYDKSPARQAAGSRGKFKN
jgi:hypothetical protein